MNEARDRWAWNLVSHVMWICSHSTTLKAADFNPYRQGERILPAGSGHLLKPAGLPTRRMKAKKATPEN